MLSNVVLISNKITRVILMAVLVCLVSFATTSNSIAYAADKSYDDISKEYNLKTVLKFRKMLFQLK
ncbi:MAG: hypothetical protein JL50_09630 [Peptococcaceae bacterium BICA1-7]|nr:MAG: hypothetical protein JL50_09630 [Peptococcaceae bacterium BICA1-7]HBV95541.1 hypothetical protein [Desulfotomaculum sp.]